MRAYAHGVVVVLPIQLEGRLVVLVQNSKSSVFIMAAGGPAKVPVRGGVDRLGALHGQHPRLLGLYHGLVGVVDVAVLEVVLLDQVKIAAVHRGVVLRRAGFND